MWVPGFTVSYVSTGVYGKLSGYHVIWFVSSGVYSKLCHVISYVNIIWCNNLGQNVMCNHVFFVLTVLVCVCCMWLILHSWCRSSSYVDYNIELLDLSVSWCDLRWPAVSYVWMCTSAFSASQPHSLNTASQPLTASPITQFWVNGSHTQRKGELKIETK